MRSERINLSGVAFLVLLLCGAKKLGIFHHEPTRTDEQIDQIFKDTIQNQQFDFELFTCAEGNVYEL
jgi:phosphoribosyl 1,2-cyclic phosphodiesterase